MKFNAKLTEIAGRYKGRDIAKKLDSCKASEPLPSKPYALPKDHKPGELKGRPIISTCESVVRPLSQLVADALNALVKLHVPAHLPSTTSFVEALKACDLTGDIQFGSLDVTNLYGSIPLEDDKPSNTKGLITVATRFFEAHRQDCVLADLAPTDFTAVLRLVLLEDVYFFNGVTRAQVSGVAMGNCAAPPLAIIYMDFIEKDILEASPEVVFWKRYIDDVFFVTKGTAEQLLAKANSITPCICFTCEVPENQKIPFLDTLVCIQGTNLSFELYIKPSHSGTCLPFDAHVPLSRKRCLILAEHIRAQRIASHELVEASVEKITKRLSNNGYPEKYIKRTLLANNRTEHVQPDFTSFLKLPYVCESQKRKVLQLRRDTGLNERIRVIFTTERPLGWQFRPQHETPPCPENCVACRTAERTGRCFTKDAVYWVSCKICGAVYIGQTNRTMRSRITEHSKTATSHVFQHMESHGLRAREEFVWKVLATHRYTSARLAMEALFIRRSQAALMNGCDGMRLLSFL